MMNRFMAFPTLTVLSATGCADPGVSYVHRIAESDASSTSSSSTPVDASSASTRDSGDESPWPPDASQADGSAPGPCPAGYMCTDLAALGITAKDGSGREIKNSCGNGEIVDCDDANPALTCGALENPFCAHLEVGGSQLVACGQLCTP